MDDQAIEILKSIPPRISDLVEPWAERLPDQPALVEAGSVWTYRQLAAAISEAAIWLSASGVRAGDRVMLVCENCSAFVAIFLALAKLDAWAVLVNGRLSPREVDQIRDHCGARCTIYTTAVSLHAVRHAKRHGAVIREVGSLGPVALSPLNDAIDPEPCGSDLPNRVAVLIYTSGSTGLPKGVMLTHRNLLYQAAASQRIRHLSQEDRLYGILPMSHASGLSLVLLGGLMSGATIYLTARFDPVAMVDTLENDGVTVLIGVPSVFSLFLEYMNARGFRSRKFPSLRLISSNGAPLHTSLKRKTEEFFGLTLHHGYGVTECSPGISVTRIDSSPRNTSVGYLYPGVQIKIVAENGQFVTSGEVGELWVRTPGLMKGYYKAPEETAAAINSEGWYNTRDLARFEDENLYIVGRTKDLIVRFGFNVYPAEVEAVLNSHPAVARSAVVGRDSPSTEGGEDVIAFVQLAPDSEATESEIGQHASQRLGPYKSPSQIILVNDMPRTPSGKIAKLELAKILEARAAIS